MSAPSPFETSRAIGNNISGALKAGRDENAIERILSEATQSGNPDQLQGAIGKILSQVSPEKQPMAIKYLENQYERVQEKQKLARQQAAAEKYGVDANLPPALQSELFKQNAKNQRLNSIYGQAPSNSQPMIGQTPQQGIPQDKGQHQINQTQPSFGLENKSDEELTMLAGHPDKEVSEPAKQLQKRRLANRKEDRADLREFNKQVSESYKENEDFINKTFDQYEDSLRRDAILGRLEQLNENGELSESGTYNLLETLGLDPEWLQNPANSEYTKLALDLLGGGTLQADYGSRVLQSEFAVSQQRIPTLSQTPEGRKQISENIKAMLLPAKLKKERMQYYLDKSARTGEPLPHNLRGRILQDIKPQLEESYDKFKERNGRYKVKPGSVPDDNALEKYYFLSDGNEKKAIKMMQEDGYDTE